ncbi:MAG TPA: hypothetical protein VGS20_08935 [Candidatus Acidoferrales bacterium]|nr:hypothetical protein [Candidatus Acidoferrales bacterium]
MRLRLTPVVLSLCLFWLAASPVRAQMSGEKPPVYTYVSQWTIPRTQWGDMAKAQQATNEILDKLVADGTLLEYGSAETAVHDPKGPTHAGWFVGSSLAAIFKAEDAVRSTIAADAALYGSGPHDDELLVSTDYDSHSGSFQNALLRGISSKLKPGMEPQFRAAWDQTIRPVLEKLMAEGAIHGWSYDNEWLIKEPGRMDTVILANGPEGLDRYVAAIRELLQQNPSALAPLIAATEPDSRQDFLLTVTAVHHK